MTLNDDAGEPSKVDIGLVGEVAAINPLVLRRSNRATSSR